jgi:hypothetical protein
MGPSGLHLVQPTAESGGTWGEYEHIPPNAVGDGFTSTVHTYVFPNRDVPNEQISSRGIGWDATESWMSECQVWLAPDSRIILVCTSDADTDNASPDKQYLLDVNGQTGVLGFTWNDQVGHSNTVTVADVVSLNRWLHVAFQKNTDSDVIRVYLDGVLRITETATYPIPCFDGISLRRYGDGISYIREFSVRTLAVLPITPFTPGVVSFQSAIGDTQQRWNSYMLV